MTQTQIFSSQFSIFNQFSNPQSSNLLVIETLDLECKIAKLQIVNYHGGGS